MTSIRNPGLALCAAAAMLFLPLQFAGAQQLPGCQAPTPVADGNVVVRCRRVTIEIERGADVGLNRRKPGGEPQSATLRSGALYIDDTSKGGRGSFQIQTPDAIASVRGTSWAVDVTTKQSSVFVVAGVVGVRRRLDGQSVSLTAGEGVDVTPETTPLVVKRWPPERAAALLARFGR